MTKVLNPLIVKLAGRRHFPMAAQIQHVGRRSGKVYRTPASAHVRGDMILIALTFGNQSDWARNVRAAGGCTVRINGRSYRATNPQFVSREQAAPCSRRRSARSSEPACECSASVSSCAWTPSASRVLPPGS
jgi:deazaflavin-dependent oxidoreductase (nitroreductase family)